MQTSINVSEQEIKKLITDLEMKQSQVFDKLYNASIGNLKPVLDISESFHVLKKDLASMADEMSRNISTQALAFAGSQEKIVELSEKLAGRHNLKIYAYNALDSNICVTDCREIQKAVKHTEKGGFFLNAQGFVLMAEANYFRSLKYVLEFSNRIDSEEYIEHVKCFIADEEPRLKSPLSFHKEVVTFNRPIKELKELYLFVKDTNHIASIDVNSFKQINTLIND